MEHVTAKQPQKIKRFFVLMVMLDHIWNEYKKYRRIWFVFLGVVIVATRNSPSRLDIGFITLKSDANVNSRQHENNGSDWNDTHLSASK